MSDPLPDLISADQYSALTGGQSIAPAILSAASAAVRKFCRWHIAPRITETITVTPNDGPVVFLPTLRLVGVSDVNMCGYHWADADLDWDEAGMLSAPYVWGQGRRFRGLTVTITHGFDDVDDVLAVVVAVAARQAITPTGVVREQAGSVSIAPSLVAPNVAGGIVLLQHERDALAAYRVGR